MKDKSNLIIIQANEMPKEVVFNDKSQNQSYYEEESYYEEDEEN